MATPPTGNPEGRPTLYRPEYCELVQTEMAKGYSLGGFAGSLGVSRQTITQWMQDYPEFSGAVSAAKTARLRQWETAAMKSAFTTEGGSPTTIIFGLKNAGSDDWVEKSEVKQTIEHDLTRLPDDKLASLIEVLTFLNPSSNPDGGSSGEGSPQG